MPAKMKGSPAGAIESGQNGSSAQGVGERRKFPTKTKIFGNVALGGLMVGIVYNATLNQGDHSAPVVSVETVDARRAVASATVPALTRAEEHIQTASATAPAVDMTPTGAIAPPRSIPLKTHSKSSLAKAASRKSDGITAFLSGKTTGH